MRRLVRTIIVASLCLVLTAPVAEARRAASVQERSAMTRAIRTLDQNDTHVVLANKSWVSTVNKRWGFAHVRTTAVDGTHLFGFTIFSRATANARTWQARNTVVTFAPCRWRTMMGARVYRDVVRLACGG